MNSGYPEKFNDDLWFKDVIPQMLLDRDIKVYPRNADDSYPEGERCAVIFPKFMFDSWEVSHYKCMSHPDNAIEAVGDTPELCLTGFLVQLIMEDEDNNPDSTWAESGQIFGDWFKANESQFQPETVKRIYKYWEKK